MQFWKNGFSVFPRYFGKEIFFKFFLFFIPEWDGSVFLFARLNGFTKRYDKIGFVQLNSCSLINYASHSGFCFLGRVGNGMGGGSKEHLIILGPISEVVIHLYILFWFEKRLSKKSERKAMQDCMGGLVYLLGRGTGHFQYVVGTSPLTLVLDKLLKCFPICLLIYGPKGKICYPYYEWVGGGGVVILLACQ